MLTRPARLAPIGSTVLCLLMLGVVASGLPGCASMGSGLEPPEVSLVDLAALPSEGFEQRFAITVRVVNPNAVALSGDGIDIRLDVNDRPLGRALSSEAFEIPRLGEKLVTLVATTNLLDVFRQAMALPAAGGRLDYSLEGRVLLSGSLGWLGFSREGSLIPEASKRR